METGSFIELQFPSGREYYSGDSGIARLNSGRAAIYHAFRLTGCRCLWLPYYQCDTVAEFLGRKNVTVKYYGIDSDFNPVGLCQSENEAVLIVNYYGVMSVKRLSELSAKFDNVIIDNSQGFFAEPADNCYNVYSARKFVGVPDGAYVLGRNAERYTEEYGQCFSSDTAGFLLMRCEYGCEGKAYEARSVNEHRIDSEDIMRMSALTRTILDGTDYGLIAKKRRENFMTACGLLDSVNRIDARKYYDETCVPMVYPLVVEDDGLLPKLLAYKHFQGHWWSYLLDRMSADSFEYYLSRYVIPVTIDQRYGEKEIRYIAEVVNGG